MVRIKDENINTIEWWDELHEGNKPHNVNITEQFRRFFDFGYLPKDQEISILDVACGEMLYLKDLPKEFPLVKWRGLDFSPVVMEKNKNYMSSATFYTLDIMKEDIPEVFDYIVSMHSFEHFDDPVVVLERCRKACKKQLIICVPYEDAWSREKSHIHKFTLDDPWNDYENFKITDKKEIFYVFNGEAE